MGPNQAPHLTGAALLVSRDIKLLQRLRQVSLVDAPTRAAVAAVRVDDPGRLHLPALGGSWELN